MGFTGMHLLVLLVTAAIGLLVVAAIAGGLYLVIKKSVAAGVREGHRPAAPQDQQHR